MFVPVLVVDGANVVGSVPDGWWRDRAGAAGRLRDALVPVAGEGLSYPGAPAELTEGPVEVILVLEGRARGIQPVYGITIVEADGSGDDAIVEVVAERAAESVCFVATADRELSDRVRAHGAVVIGPRRVPRRL
ncbi:MAG: NTP pyrophosphohydrolase [Myxococcota bacterium]